MSSVASKVSTTKPLLHRDGSHSLQLILLPIKFILLLSSEQCPQYRTPVADLPALYRTFTSSWVLTTPSGDPRIEFSNTLLQATTRSSTRIGPHLHLLRSPTSQLPALASATDQPRPQPRRLQLPVVAGARTSPETSKVRWILGYQEGHMLRQIWARKSLEGHEISQNSTSSRWNRASQAQR